MSLRGMGSQVLFIDPKELASGGSKMYSEAGQHVLVSGSSGAEKTSTLLKITYNLYKVGETVIWRDDANLEFISFVNILPIKLWLPKGCDLLLKHPNIEKEWYDYMNLETLFPRFDPDRLNVILFDLFTVNHKLTVQFWTTFIYEIYRYKRLRIKDPWSFVVDELNDLAPGSRRGYIQGQMILSSNIYSSMKKFRKMKIRLVGSTHNFNDIHFPIRGQFMYYFFKAMRRDHVPERFWNYAQKIEAMKANECIIVDRRGNHQFINDWTEKSRSHIDPNRWIKLEPKQMDIPWTGEIEELEMATKSKRAEEWKLRAMILAKVLIDIKEETGEVFTYREVAAILDLSTTTAHNFFNASEQIPREAWEDRLELAELTIAEYNRQRAIRQSGEL